MLKELKETTMMMCYQIDNINKEIKLIKKATWKFWS